MQISTAQRAVRTIFTSISALFAAILPSTNGVFNFSHAEMLKQQLEFETGLWDFYFFFLEGGKPSSQIGVVCIVASECFWSSDNLVCIVHFSGHKHQNLASSFIHSSALSCSQIWSLSQVYWVWGRNEQLKGTPAHRRTPHSNLGQFRIASPPPCLFLGGGKKPESPQDGGRTCQTLYRQ